jgi:methyl-galactoside transport system ATP-binding protein
MLMVGRDTTHRFPSFEMRPGRVRLEVRNLTAMNPRSFSSISFQVREGEILGIGGLVGAQRTELVESIFGLRAVRSGSILIDGQSVRIRAPYEAIGQGLGLITEDRRESGIFPLLSVTMNTAVASLGAFRNRIGLLDFSGISRETKRINASLRTKSPTMETRFKTFRRDQQKVIVSRWLMTLPDILIMDEPTRGIDVGAKYEIYLIMEELVKQGKSIIMVSSEMPELIGMSHRIMVLCNGHLTGIVEKSAATQESIMALATQFNVRNEGIDSCN